MNQRRPDQLGTILHRAIQARLDKGLADPRITGLITVTGVKVSPDLKTATVSVSVMPHDKQDLALHGLRSAARHIRREVGDEVAIHRLPELAFRLDKSLEKQAGVLEAIARATEERQRRESAAQAAPADPPAGPAPGGQGEPGEKDAYAGEPGEETKA